MNINLFFLRENQGECIVTIQETIPEKYHQKVTVELEPAKKWVEGINRNFFGAASIDESELDNFNDDEYFYINTDGWVPGFAKPGYMALQKEVANGKIFRSENIVTTGIRDSTSTFFLFTE